MIKFKEIPIFILSFERLIYLKKLVSRLEKDGYTNLIIIDNASKDIDLLKYLHSLPYKVHFLEKNYGHLVLWNSGLFNSIIENNYYVLTDPDILPIDECPNDYVEQFYNVLQEYPKYWKVGFSLKIDDLLETFKNKYDVIRWESFFYENKISENPLLYEANIDTTFALYRPGGCQKNFGNAIRTGGVYTARHLAWYVNSNMLPQEDKLYFQSACVNKTTSWFNDSVINNINYWTIAKLIKKQRGIDYFKFNKKIITNEWLVDIKFGEILKTTFWLLSKKIKLNLKNLSKNKSDDKSLRIGR
jgi:hypothetical protein